ncbi:SMC-Scp complex subunit ScpB [Pelagibius marinus]|uniref:SMC-Scp complex subunit ScpB n=1 Tax=Pelagibius marinus TaxID=2762760 RepID=UPI001D03B4A5
MTSETPETDMPEAAEAELPEAEMAAEDPQDDAVEDDEVEASAEDEEEESDGEESDDDESGESETGATDFDNLRLVEALLFASAEPLAPAQLARFLPEDVALEPLLNDLQALYANRGVNLVKRGARWAFRTAEDLSPRMELENKVVRKLSRVALETLAVIAYHQPVTRAEIEEVRGVALSKGTLDALLEIGWIRPKGRRKTPGRPVTWGTSDAFLDHFGLEGLDALPGVEELKAAGLLDTRPALTALSDRGLLPAAGEIAPEEVEEDEDDEYESEIIEGSERELLDATFGEDMLPQEVDLSAAAEEGDAEDAADDLEDEVLEAAGEAAGDVAADASAGGPEDAGLEEEDFEAEDSEEAGFDEDDLEEAAFAGDEEEEEAGAVDSEDEPQRSTG